MEEVQTLIKSCSQKKGIIVLDCDECAFYNHPDQTICRRPEISILYDHFSQKPDWKIYFCTARADSPGGADFIKSQLRKLMYTNFEKVFLRPEMDDIGTYKFNTRKKIASLENEPITIMGGDQWTDIFADGVYEAEKRGVLTDESILISQPDEITRYGLKLTEKRGKCAPLIKQ